jgi:hypothetical protein
VTFTPEEGTPKSSLALRLSRSRLTANSDAVVAAGTHRANPPVKPVVHRAHFRLVCTLDAAFSDQYAEIVALMHISHFRLTSNALSHDFTSILIESYWLPRTAFASRTAVLGSANRTLIAGRCPLGSALPLAAARDRCETRTITVGPLSLFSSFPSAEAASFLCESEERKAE